MEKPETQLLKGRIQEGVACVSGRHPGAESIRGQYLCGGQAKYFDIESYLQLVAAKASGLASRKQDAGEPSAVRH